VLLPNLVCPFVIADAFQDLVDSTAISGLHGDAVALVDGIDQPLIVVFGDVRQKVAQVGAIGKKRRRIEAEIQKRPEYVLQKIFQQFRVVLHPFRAVQFVVVHRVV